MRTRILALAAAVGLLAALGTPAGAQNEGIPSIPLSINEMEHVNNVPQAGGNNLAFFEREEDDGEVRRFVVASTMGNGFDIVEVTDPTHPTRVGSYVLGDDPVDDPEAAVQKSSLGLNYHPWVDVNPRRNIVALSIETPASVTVRHGTTGVIFVDISDVASPRALGKIDGAGGPHTLRMVGDNCVYTSLPTRVIDYSNPMNPLMGQLPLGMAGHEYWPDPNVPGITWVGTETVGRWAAWDTSDCAQPTLVADRFDSAVDTVHEVYPAPDSSYVGVADFTREGQTQTACPGGGLHFYDVSGKHVPGGSLEHAEKMGVWFAPFEGTLPTASGTNHASCTLHSWQMAPEREIALGGLYTGGTWVLDPSGPTGPDGDYDEYDGPRGRTTWGTTLANVVDALDFVNATQWLPFDLEDPAHERLVFVTGWERGMDVYRYTGPLPKKDARLQVSASAAGGTVTGALDRFAVLTSEGWANKPLAGETLEVTSGGTSVEVVTGEDGGFGADLGLSSGTHQVTVTWAGNDVFEAQTTTRTVTVP